HIHELVFDFFYGLQGKFLSFFSPRDQPPIARVTPIAREALWIAATWRRFRTSVNNPEAETDWRLTLLGRGYGGQAQTPYNIRPASEAGFVSIRGYDFSWSGEADLDRRI